MQKDLELSVVDNVNETLTKLAVDIATVKEKSINNADALSRIEGRLEDSLFREEYERRHKLLEDTAHNAERIANEALAKTRDIEVAGRVWRRVFSAALALLALFLAYLQLPHHL